MSYQATHGVSPHGKIPLAHCARRELSEKEGAFRLTTITPPTFNPYPTTRTVSGGGVGWDELHLRPVHLEEVHWAVVRLKLPHACPMTKSPFVGRLLIQYFHVEEQQSVRHRFRVRDLCPIRAQPSSRSSSPLRQSPRVASRPGRGPPRLASSLTSSSGWVSQQWRFFAATCCSFPYSSRLCSPFSFDCPREVHWAVFSR